MTAIPRRRAGLLALALLLGLLPAGCGKKGPPVAPERRFPATVTDLRASVEERAVLLAWTNPTRRVDGQALRDLAMLKVHRREEPEGTAPKPAMLARGRVVGYEEVASIRLAAPSPAEVQGGAVRWTDTSALVLDRRYVYVVTALDATGRSSAPSARASVTFLSGPAPPRDVRATAGDRTARLAWEAPGALADGRPIAGEIRYLVFRASGEGPPQRLTPEPLAQLEFADRDLDNDRSYRYSVRAMRIEPAGAATGQASPPVEVTPRDMTPPSAPRNLVAVPAAATVRLAWSGSPEADVAAYAVYRAAAGEDLVRIGTTTAATTAFVDREVRPGATYRYAVTAIDGALASNESLRSEVVTVTVPP